MAINPAQISPNRPKLLNGEALLLQRTGVSYEIQTKNFPVLHSKGSLILSTKRIIVINSQPKPLGENQFFCSFQFPLATLKNEKFNQPIFGANNLTGVVSPENNSGLSESIVFKISFLEGGCGTFLHFFLRAIKELRLGKSVLSRAAREGRLHAESSGFLDPSDPSILYVSQAKN